MRRAWVIAVVFAAAYGCVAEIGDLGGDFGSVQEPPPGGTPDDDGGTFDPGPSQNGDSGTEADAGDPNPQNPSGLDARPANPTCVAPAPPPSNTGVTVQRVFPNLSFTQPIFMLQAPNDNTRWFVVEQAGRVRVFPNNPNATANDVTTFVDITNRVTSGGEMGLLGMAFHPSFAQNGEVFLSYTSAINGPRRSVISRFKLQAGTQLLDPNSEQILLTVEQPFTNHNGGGIAFGPDGYLYIGFGDGGSGDDPLNAGQDLNTLLGKFLRIDVNNTSPGKPYAIPPDNPFAQGGGLPEIYAWGFRNPWRWSFDPASGELWVGDVGQGAREEIDRVVRGGNYGWKIREGFICRPPTTNCPTAGLIDPVVDYGRGDGVSVTGGYVYRGTAIPSLVGRFVYGDYSSGRIWAVAFDAQTGRHVPQPLASSGLNISSFGQGVDGEVYVVHHGGTLHRLAPQGTPTPSTFPDRLSATGCVDAADPKRPAQGLIPYDVNAALWSDGAAKERHFAIPDGTKIRIGADGDFDFPNGTVLMKTFFIGNKRVETRLLMRHMDGTWAGYSYEWNDAETDATLLPAGKAKAVGNQTWYFPSRAECMVCHTAAAGRTLGLELAQLDRDLRYPTGRTRNQLVTLDAIGMFETALPPRPTPLADPAGSAPVTDRARAYLHANCSGCHRPNGTGRGNIDFRHSTPLQQMGVCNVAPSHGDLGVANARLVAPGQPAQSIVSVRPKRLDAYRMPPLASRMVDPAGTALIDAWISSLNACP